MDQKQVLDLLKHIDPARLDYQSWLNVGMALQTEGLTASVWDDWSKSDGKRYHSGECWNKWASFQGSGVTAGTIYQYATEQGWVPSHTADEGHELAFDAEINDVDDDYVIVDTRYLDGQEVLEPADKDWHPVQELITYLETLFDSTETVGYVTSTWEKDGKYMPTSGNYDRTAGQLIQELNKHKNDIGAVMGDYNKNAGAWIRFNPLDGKGVKNDNVTDYRYALVESDSMPIEQQNAIVRKLELPIATLTYSGKKSVHAIVRIEAPSYEEYRKRVNYLYQVCEKNGLKIDSQNRNPSRLSRMPGIVRGEHKQFLIDTNIGKKSWDEWYEWIEGINDDLPDPESLSSEWDNLPDLSTPLIEGVLRQGHKMLLAGPSKAGKSFLLIELCIDIAEGLPWLNFNCHQGRILYVNLELDKASCLHRFKDVYEAMGVKPKGLHNIDIWNLRGKSVPMDKLAPKLIRRSQKGNYIAVVIDPIYKVLTGDENSADQMANFCNQFDKVATELKCAVIYCHHHSKGAQGGKKSMDRASGSGVFARDPDAMLDLTELDLDDSIKEQQFNRAAATCIDQFIREHANEYWLEKIGPDDRLSRKEMEGHARIALSDKEFKQCVEKTNATTLKVDQRTAWRIEGTLREFPKFPPVDLWFDYPVHKIDTDGILKDIDPDGELMPWQRAMKNRKSPEKKKEERGSKLDIIYENLSMNDDGDHITYQDIADAAGVTTKTVKNWIRESGGFEIEQSGDGKSAYVHRKKNISSTPEKNGN